MYAKGSGAIKAALYITAKSISTAAGSAINNFIQPAKPQTIADVDGNPVFAINNGATSGVVATLRTTGVDDKHFAPRMQVVVVKWGLTFTDGTYYDLPQYNTQYQLSGGDMDGRVTAVSSVV